MGFTPSPSSHRDLAEQSIYRGAIQQQPRFGQAVVTTSRPAPTFDGLSQALDRQLALGDPANEVRETRRRYNDLEVQFSAVKAQRDQYLAERDRYKQETEIQAARNRGLDDQLQHIKQQMDSVQSRHRLLEQEFTAANDELTRARATIKIQSQAIEGRVDTTIDRSIAGHTTSQTQALAPAAPARRFGQDYGFGLKPLDPRESLYGQSMPQYPPTGTSTGYESSWQPRAIEAPRQDPAVSSALVVQPQLPKPEVPWASEFSSLFQSIEKYCAKYFNTLTGDADRSWPLTLGHTVVEEANAGHTIDLAIDQETRYLLLTRIIIGWIDNRCFHSRIVKGFSQQSDQAVQDIRRQTRSNISIDVRRALARAEASTIEEITRAPGFDSWKQRQIRDGVKTMMPRLTEAAVPGAPLDVLGKAFETLFADSWRVGLLMATCPLQFSIRFPTIGARFDSTIMLNRDPYVMGPPTEVERKGARVALGITPYITVKDLLSAKMGERSVHMANILLRY
ncbi:MAG: hypothetical protein Q9166_007213 [cf. Caloplaca sp. 2 TL-2023]